MPSTSLAVERLRAELKGEATPPGDPESDRARTVSPGTIDRRPAVIARPRDAAEVSRVVLTARDTGVPLAVRGGGHGIHCVCDDGIVLDLAALRGLDIDVAGRTAWAEAGLTAGEYTAAVGEHGLATGFGDTGSVGIGGITLGGGVGYLARKHGLTIDALLAAEIVTADGELLRVDERSHPDLFWAIRGGGGNFGVVTRFQYRLEPVGAVVGGMLMLPATPELIAGFVAAADAAPDELSTIANVMPAPPMPFVPEELQGQLIIMGLLCYAGDDTEAAERAIAPFRALATPIVDMVRPIRYPEMYPPEEGEEEYHPTVAGRSLFVDTVGIEQAETIIERLRTSDAPMRVAQLRVLGGAVARVPADETAFAHRASRIMVNVAAFFTSPEDQAVREAWVDEFAGALRQSDQGIYVNFLGDEGEAGVRAAFPGATWDRLAAVKRRYDPTNLFRLNQNIPPA
ncbi:FAD-binding oxidoreductase [Micromonospora sp. CPCC 205371]|nr:FAD-binding oxidoreductase [Micromonospora sp. CPCC 205371]